MKLPKKGDSDCKSCVNKSKKGESPTRENRPDSIIPHFGEKINRFFALPGFFFFGKPHLSAPPAALGLAHRLFPTCPPLFRSPLSAPRSPFFPLAPKFSHRYGAKKPSRGLFAPFFARHAVWERPPFAVFLRAVPLSPLHTPRSSLSRPNFPAARPRKSPKIREKRPFRRKIL